MFKISVCGSVGPGSEKRCVQLEVLDLAAEYVPLDAQDLDLDAPIILVIKKNGVEHTMRMPYREFALMVKMQEELRKSYDKARRKAMTDGK